MFCGGDAHPLTNALVG
ncbi:hypothetical protein YPPY92_2640, partial [Yersinia pestis PY-92]